MKKIKRVLVTGSGEGIGLEIVKLFIKKKWDVDAHYLYKNSEFDGLKNNINKIKCDFSIQKELDLFLKKISKKQYLGLVNSAGIFDNSKKFKNRLSAINKTLLVNTIAPVYILETVFENMKKNNKGNILNLSSIGVKYGSAPDNIFYGISKLGLESATRTYSREGSKYNILVNTIRPGITNTNFYEKIGKNLKERVKLIPLKRAANPEEIAKLIYFMIAQNTFITGDIISISGGE